MSVVNVPLKDGTRAASRAAIDSAAEARMFRRPSEWRIFWEAFSRDRLALAAALNYCDTFLSWRAGMQATADVSGPGLRAGIESLGTAIVATPAHDQREGISRVAVVAQPRQQRVRH